MAKSYLARTNEFYKNYQTKIYPILKKYEGERKKIVHQVKFAKLSLIPFYAVYLYLLLFIINTADKNYAIFWGGVGLLSVLVLIIQLLYNHFVSNKRQDFLDMLKQKCLDEVLKCFSNIEICSDKQDILINDSIDTELNNISEDIFSENFEDDPAHLNAILRHLEKPAGMHNYADLSESGLFLNFDKTKIDDEFSGIYKGVSFKITEIELLAKNRRYDHLYNTVFKGIVISFKSNKKIRNRTVVLAKKDIKLKRMMYGRILCIIMLPVVIFMLYYMIFIDQKLDIVHIGYCGGFILASIFVWHEKPFDEDVFREKIEEIKLEDPKFNKKFSAYSTDEVEGRYLLTPAFMERFQKLRTSFNAKNAKCSFFGNNVMFSFETKKNLFELGSLETSLENPKSINNFYNEISSVLNMIDYFKLDQNTGL